MDELSIEFWTTLIKVARKPKDPEALRRFHVNLTHVTGQYYVMEGDLDALREDCPGIAFRAIGEGAVGCLGDLTEDELKAICLDSFGVTL